LSKTSVVRFAPSPTGYLHIGGARTALFNYLFARNTGGRFLLRIEDTDRERSTPEAVEAILEGLRWLGLEWDDEILFQSQGRERHVETANRLLEKGAAYKCFCTPEELETRRRLTRAEKRDFVYDRTCLGLSPEQTQRLAQQGKPFVVRFKIPEGTTGYDDLVHGKVGFSNETIDDFILLRSDGTPTYQLAVVADDIHMGITHIIRGDDHISNTPKQILLYRALKSPVPQFAHVPLILGPDKKRLSKRHGATSLTEYRGRGILSPALFNFLALLGWTPGEDREILSREEIISLFSIEDINKKSAVFDQTKLEWMNGRYLSMMKAEEILELVREDFEAAGLLKEGGAVETSHILRVIDTIKDRCRLTGDFLPRSRCFFPVELEYDPKAVAKHWKNNSGKLLITLAEELNKVENWSEEPLEAVLRSLAEKLQISASKLIHPLRLAITGTSVSPGIFVTMALSGKRLTLSRIREAVERLG